MSDEEWIARMRDLLRERLTAHLGSLPLREVASLDRIESLVRALLRVLAVAAFEVWAQTLTRVAIELAVTCPGCGHARKCKRRANAPMRLRVLGLTVAVPKPYFECARCDAPGVSINALLTGLSSGSASAELELRAGYLGSQHTYGKASRELGVHYGEAVQRTALRRMALKVEAHAKDYAERERAEVLAPLEKERAREGVPVLMLQGDGGVVRTGVLVPTVRGNPGHGRKTLKRKMPKRKRDTHYREIMTFDVRQPGETEASALDVLVPVHAVDGERSRRMLALAARKGLGDNTEVIGLGDMGSSLPRAFAEAFHGYDKSHYYTDWHHVCDYVNKAGDMLQAVNVPRWRVQLREAIWKRDKAKCDRLLRRAERKRVPELPKHLEKCPVQALRTYLKNNWNHINPASLKSRGFDYVSARAESQVRDRTKSRFAVAGAWKSENLEGKATLRAIIDDGRWHAFRLDYLRHHVDRFGLELALRLDKAVIEGRLSSDQRDRALGLTPTQPQHEHEAA